MLRVLLVIEDYAELVYLQTLLKKLGLDVDGVQSERAIDEAILTLNPDVILMTAAGKRLRGVDFAENLDRGAKGLPKVALLANRKQIEMLENLPMMGVDQILESPVGPSAVIDCLAALGEVDAKALKEKYAKIKASLVGNTEVDQKLIERDRLEEDRTVHIRAAEARRERYAAMAKQVGPIAGTQFTRDRVAQVTKNLRSEEATNSNLVELEAQRQEFVRQLFKRQSEE